MVVLRSKSKIEGLRKAGDLVAQTFATLRPRVQPGVRLRNLDRIVEEFLASKGEHSPYKGYRPSSHVSPFPGAVCAAVNKQVIHGFSTSRKLDEGDILGLDVGVLLGG